LFGRAFSYFPIYFISGKAGGSGSGSGTQKKAAIFQLNNCHWEVFTFVGGGLSQPDGKVGPGRRTKRMKTRTVSVAIQWLNSLPVFAVFAFAPPAPSNRSVLSPGLCSVLTAIFLSIFRMICPARLCWMSSSPGSI